MHVILAFFHPVPFHAWMLMPWGGGPTVTPAGIIPWWDEKGTGGGDRFDESVLCHTVDEYYVRLCQVSSTYVALVNTLRCCAGGDRILHRSCVVLVSLWISTPRGLVK